MGGTGLGRGGTGRVAARTPVGEETMTPKSAREEILAHVRAALDRSGRPAPTVNVADRLAARTAGEPDKELEALLNEISALGGLTRRLTGANALEPALAALVQAEQVRTAVLWPTPELDALGLARMLRGRGVAVISPHTDSRTMATCDLGITGVDAALPETGTLLLRSGPERPRAVSLLPRVHLALVRPTALRADLRLALADVKGDGYAVCITGPSRTADIELTVTIGVHGPQVLYVWALG